MDKPLLSIVIANYNYGCFLEEAIRSILAQDVDEDVEIIVCDAASTDNSVDIVRKYAYGLPPNTSIYDLLDIHRRTSATEPCPPATKITWWCSEKDGGQSAAFNKGFSHARGEWLTWLNADDLLLPGTIAAFARFVSKNPSSEWITGDMLSFDSSSREIRQVNWGPHCQPPLLRRNRSFDAVFGPTTFWRKSLYEKVGPIDERLYYGMDIEYWARITMAGVKQCRLNHICWGFRCHDDSKTAGVAGIQTEATSERCKEETLYLTRKTGYCVQPRLTDIWYLVWVLWRIVDFSWIVRGLMKRKYEGKSLDGMFHLR